MVRQTGAQLSGVHRSIHFLIIEAEAAGTWRYSFFIGDRNFSGTVQAVLGLLAARRVRMKIDRALRQNASIEAHTDTAFEPDVPPNPIAPPPAASSSASNSFRDRPELMSPQSVGSSTVAFSCAGCSVIYQTVQVSIAAKGVFRCTACYQPVHRWDGAYDYRSWQRLEMEVETLPLLVPPTDPKE